MPSTSRRKLAISRLAAPLLALLAGACADPPATSETDTGSGSSGSTTDDTPTSEPTTDDTGVPAEGEARYFLRIDDALPPPVNLEMDKAKSLEVFGEAAARQIKLIDVDSAPLLTEILARILASCGDDWDVYDGSVPNNKLPVDPKHDCSKTELGKTYGLDWKTSPQYQMVRLLTMTARNARIGGTVMNDMELLFRSNENNFGEFSFQDVLAASMFCPINKGEDPMLCTNKLKSTSLDEAAQEAILHVRPFISTEVLAETLKVTLMASHPNIANEQGLLGVTLYDALKDMQPLSEKFGPVGDHPGLLMPDDENFTTHSDALTDQFQMIASAESNLRRVEGIDASVGAGEMFISIAEAPLAFDFMDEQKVQLLGIAPMPTVDMRMRIMELGNAQPGKLAPVPSCDGTHGDGIEVCKQNLPGKPVGTQYVWSQPLWSLERIIAQAAYTTFADRTYARCFVNFGVDCLTDAKIGVGGDPKGWTLFTSELDTPKFPPEQYFWEMLLDVAQETLHDFTGPDVEDYDGDGNKTEITGRADGKPEIEEGQLNPIFALKAVSIGLTADQMIAEIRPNLQKQAAFIANVILGKYWKHNAHLDFYYRRAAPEAPPVLFFVHESDPRPDATGEALAPYTYAKPGFFADAELTKKLSSTQIDGVPEADHEKFQLVAGETTLFIQDDEGKVHRLRFFVPPGADATEIVVHVRPV